MTSTKARFAILGAAAGLIGLQGIVLAAHLTTTPTKAASGGPCVVVTVPVTGTIITVCDPY